MADQDKTLEQEIQHFETLIRLIPTNVGVNMVLGTLRDFLPQLKLDRDLDKRINDLTAEQARSILSMVVALAVILRESGTSPLTDIARLFLSTIDMLSSPEVNDG